MINLDDCITDGITLVSVKTHQPTHILVTNPCLMAGRHQLLDGGGVRYAAVYAANSIQRVKGRYCVTSSH